MAVRPLAVAVMVVGLVLAGCAAAPLPAPTGTAHRATAIPGATEAVATAVPDTATTVAAAAITPSVAVAGSPTTVTSTIQAPSTASALPAQAPYSPPPTVGAATATPPAPTPAHDDGTALRAWGIAPDEKFYILQSSGIVQRNSPDLAAVVDRSGPLFDGQDPGRTHMAIGEHFLVLSSETLTRTLVLQRESFAPVWQIPRAGTVALDGSRRLFVISDDAVWAYDLANASAAPTPVTKWPVDAFTPRPRNLAVDAQGNQLLVTLHDVSASPPHQQEWYASYDLDSLQPLRSFPSQLGELTPPSVSSDWIVSGMAAKNGFLGSKVSIFDREGRELRAAQPFDGRPVIDQAGEWIYVVRDRGIWVLRASDLSLAAASPEVGSPSLDVLLSPDGSRLYVVEDGSIATKDTARLRAGGIAPWTGPVLASWFGVGMTDFFRARFYPAPGAADTAFLVVGGYGETWRSEDRGKTWRLLPGLVYPNFHYVTNLSISPDFVADKTMVAVVQGVPGYLRSTDGGDTWSAWQPPLAFVSERDGNREVYTADRGAPDSGSAQNIVRRTNDPAADENPAWSPGWTRIAFQSNRNGNWDIFTMQADCDPSVLDAEAKCDVRQLTDNPADDMLAAWSPDGRWIAFVSTRDGKADLYLVPSAGGTAVRVTNSLYGAWRPAWLPDSQRLLYAATASDGTNDIAMGTVAGSDGQPTMAEARTAIDSRADERDPAVGRDMFVYLSNEGGFFRTYARYTSYDQATSFPFTVGTEPEGHPALLGDNVNTVLVTLARDGQTGIYRASFNGYEPFIVGQSFNGQPAAGPVPWQPSADWSQQAIHAWQQ